LSEKWRHPFGLLLVTGPTGSGKSTTLYSILAERNEPGNWSNFKAWYTCGAGGSGKGALTFLASALFLRQDPDVILVGETIKKRLKY